MTKTREGLAFAVVLTIAIVFVALLIIVPRVMPFDPNVTNLAGANAAPGVDGHVFGTDALGRDILLRTIAGGQESMLISFAVVVLVLIIGVAVGLAAGYLGGAVDAVLSKVIVMFQSFPSFVLAIAIAAVLGQGTRNMIIAIVAVYWTQFARLARSFAISQKNSGCVRAARVCGAGPGAVMFKYVLPNLASPLVVMAMLSIGDVVLTMAGLSFLGLGPERPTNEWGAMMSEARSYFQIAPQGIMVPGVALFLAVTIFNLLGDTLRDCLDVRSSSGRRAAEGNVKSNKGGRMKLKGKGKGLVAGVLAATLIVAGLAGCSSSDQQQSSQESSTEATAEKVLRGGSTAYFYAETPDPANNWDGWELEYYGIAENLLKLNDDFTVEPWLAESVTNIDDTTWELKIREGIKFSNGVELTADKAKAALERTMKENSRAEETLPIKSIEADGQTLTITTDGAVPAFENALCDPIFSIYDTGDDIDYAENTPCTGPYMIESFTGDPDYCCTLVPNENYWNGTPKLDRIELSTYFDEDSMAMAMQNGELDLIAMPAASTYAKLSDTTQYTKVAQTSTRADFVRFNMKHKVVANKAVREAISYCIDRDGYANTITGGTEVPSYGIYSESLPFGGTDGLNVTVSSTDTEAAAAVLDEAGITDTDGDGVRELDGEDVEITLVNCTQYERFVQIASDLQSKLESIGVTLKIKDVDYWLQDSKTYKKDDPDMTIDSYGMAPTGDAGYFTNMCFVTGGSANFGSYSNEEVDALAEQLKTEFDETKRTEIIKEIEQKVLDDCAYIFFANSTTNYLTTTSVSDIVAAPSEYYLITVDTDIQQ